MKRITTKPRIGWKEKVESLGFSFHTLMGEKYWDEFHYYTFTKDEIETVETATNELYEMCLTAVQHVIDNNLYHLFKIDPIYINYIVKSWDEEHPAIYGRFDFVYDGKSEPKMLEFNADTPTSLFEASVVQWHWLQDVDSNSDQFNSMHEKLIDYWKYLKEYLHDDYLYFNCVKDNPEDLVTVEYLRDTAIQAGLKTKFIFIDDIGWDEHNQVFLDLDDCEIRNMFKLYPWEWMINEDFGKNILLDRNSTFWIEPAWKMILSNKAILPILWQLFPNHKNLLPAYFDDSNFKYKDYVKKPLLSREGANIEIVLANETIKTDGDYGEEGYIYQEFNSLPNFDDNYPVIGSWLIGGDSAGIGIRETVSLITDNLSRFIPHLFK